MEQADRKAEENHFSIIKTNVILSLLFTIKQGHTLTYLQQILFARSP